MSPIASYAAGLADFAPNQGFSASSPGARFAWDQPRGKRYYLGRGALGLTIAAGHLLILWLVLIMTGVTGRPLPREKHLTVIDLSEVEKPDAPAKPAEHAQVSKIRPQLLRSTVLTIAAPPAAAGTGTGHGCGMAGVVAKGISENPDAMAAVAALPDDVRSETDAVMLWNGAWLDTGQTSVLSALPIGLVPPSADPVAALKQVILASLEQAPAECLEVETIGPQFIPISEPGRTTMLVIGSGAWRWSSLLEPEIDPLASPGADQSAADGRLAAGPTGN